MLARRPTKALLEQSNTPLSLATSDSRFPHATSPFTGRAERGLGVLILALVAYLAVTRIDAQRSLRCRVRCGCFTSASTNDAALASW
jgi:hypothetical protein